MQIFILLCPNCRYPKVYDTFASYKVNGKNGIAFQSCSLPWCRAAVAKAAPRSNKAAPVDNTPKPKRDLTSFVREYKRNATLHIKDLGTYQGWSLKVEMRPIEGEKFIAENGTRSLIALSLKRLKLKIDSALIIPQILDKQSNFV